ncbi:hypothetical protein AAG906_027925 [Vitis piasezkii]
MVRSRTECRRGPCIYGRMVEMSVVTCEGGEMGVLGKVESVRCRRLCGRAENGGDRYGKGWEWCDVEGYAVGREEIRIGVLEDGGDRAGAQEGGVGLMVLSEGVWAVSKRIRIGLSWKMVNSESWEDGVRSVLEGVMEAVLGGLIGGDRRMGGIGAGLGVEIGSRCQKRGN